MGEHDNAVKGRFDPVFLRGPGTALCVICLCLAVVVSACQEQIVIASF